MARTGVVEATLRLDAKQWENAISRATQQAGEFVSDTGTLMAGLGTALLGVSATLGAVTIGLKSAGDQALELRKNLSGAFSGNELDGISEKIAELSALELQGLDTDELTEAAKRLNTFSDDVSGDLERVANVSAKTGESFGSLKDYFAEFTINPDAQNSLKEIANITPEKLAAFGATLDSTGEKILTTGKYAESAQRALRAVVDSEYGGAVLQMASGTDQLRAQLQLLAQDAGSAVATLSDAAAGEIAPLVGGFRDFVGTFGPMIGIVTGLGAAAAGLGAAAIGATLLGGAFQTIGGTTGALFIAEQLVLKLGVTSLPALATSAAAAAASWLLLAGAGAAVLLLFHQTTKAINEQTAAEERLLQIEQQRAQWAKTAGGLLGKTTEELRKQGTTSKEAAQALLGLQDRMEAARAAGNTAIAESLQRQILELKARKEELAQLEADQRELDAKTDPLGFNRPKSLEEEKERIAFLRAEGKITERQQLEMQKAALDSWKSDEKAKRALAIETADFERQEREKAAEEEKKRKDEGFAAEMDRIKLELTQKKISQEEALALEEAALTRFARSDAEKRALVQRRAEQAASDQKQAEDKLEKSRADNVKDRLDQIQLLRTEEKITAQQQIKAYDDVLARYKLNEDEKAKVRQKRADVEKTLRDKEAADEKKRSDDAKKLQEKNADDLAKAREKSRELQQDDLDDRLDGIQSRTSFSGAGNAAELKKLFEEQQKVAEEQIRAEGDKLKEATKSAEARAQVEQNVNEEIRQQIAETAEAYKDALGDQADAVEKYADSLQKESKYTGKDNSSKLRQALQEQLNLEAEMIRVEGEKAKASATSAQERARIEERVQQQIRAEQLETAEAYKQALDEQAKALEDHKKRERGESSFQGAFGIEDLNESMKRTLATTTRSKREASLATFSALPGAVNPQRADAVATIGQSKSIGAEVGSAVAAAMKSQTQKVQVDIAVSDDRVKTKVSDPTSVNGRMSAYEQAGRGQRSGPRVR